MSILSDKDHIIRRLHNKSKIDMTTDCWLWQGAIDESGYGKTEFKNEDGEWKFISVHRLSACLFMGMPPYAEWHVLHRDELCKNRNCWNPNHLYLGDQADNYNDAVKKGTHNQARKTCCTTCGGPYTLKWVESHTRRERYCKRCTRNNFLLRREKKNKDKK